MKSRLLFYENEDLERLRKEEEKRKIYGDELRRQINQRQKFKQEQLAEKKRKEKEEEEKRIKELKANQQVATFPSKANFKHRNFQENDFYKSDDEGDGNFISINRARSEKGKLVSPKLPEISISHFSEPEPRMNDLKEELQLQLKSIQENFYKDIKEMFKKQEEKLIEIKNKDEQKISEVKELIKNINHDKPTLSRRKNLISKMTEANKAILKNSNCFIENKENMSINANQSIKNQILRKSNSRRAKAQRESNEVKQLPIIPEISDFNSQELRENKIEDKNYKLKVSTTYLGVSKNLLKEEDNKIKTRQNSNNFDSLSLIGQNENTVNEVDEILNKYRNIELPYLTGNSQETEPKDQYSYY